MRRRAACRCPSVVAGTLILLAAAYISPAEEAPTREASAPSAPVNPSPEESQREIRLEYSTQPMTGNARLTLGAVQLSQTALDVATRPLLAGILDRKGGKGIANRAAWSLWIDLPLVKLGETLNHELGHALRLPSDASNVKLQVSRPGLPLLFVGGSLVWSGSRAATVQERLAITAGGWEAGSLFLQRTRHALYASDTMHYGDAMAYSFSKLVSSIYLLDGTRESRLLSDDVEQRRSDPLIYAEELAEIEEGTEFSPDAVSRRAQELRRGAYVNLVDYALWATTWAWIKGRVVEGRRFTPTPWLRVGPVRLAPSASFTLTPYGPETTALTGWRVGPRSGTAHVRWSGRVDGRRVIGGGGSFRLDRQGLPIEKVLVDAWRDGEGKLGGRLELSGVWRSRPSSRLGLSWHAGVKSRGPLAGFPTAPNGYVGVGLSAAF